MTTKHGDVPSVKPTQAQINKALHRWYLALVAQNVYPRNAARKVEYTRAHCALVEIVRRVREPALLRALKKQAREVKK